jgi:N-sulfoglucosamine sulfohydrolase
MDRSDNIFTFSYKTGSLGNHTGLPLSSLRYIRKLHIAIMKKFLSLLSVAIIMGFSLNAQNKQPNILLILADDLTFYDIEPYGSNQVQTPFLAKLAKEGVCLDNMFTSTAMCSPTRQSILTGLYPVRNGAYPNHSNVYSGIKSLAHHLKSLGYTTAAIGKRDFGDENAFPFVYLGGQNTDNGNGPGIPLENAEKFMRSQKSLFFLTVGFNEPHVPLTRGNPDAYPPNNITVPPGFVATAATKKQMSRYFAEITYLDSLIGRLLKMVNDAGLAENTVVIFTSEHGGQLPFGKWTCYDRGLKTAFIIRWPGKVQAGSRNVALLQYTDVAPTLIDIAGGNPSTINTGIADATGYTGFDGQSFRNVLNGNKDSIRQFVFGVHTTKGIINGNDSYPVRSIRDKKYLYIRNLNSSVTFQNILTKSPVFASWLKADNQTDIARAQAYINRPAEELYDVEKDPNQLNNLAGNSQFAALLKHYALELDAFMKKQGDEGMVTEKKALERQPKSGGEEEQ